MFQHRLHYLGGSAQRIKALLSDYKSWVPGGVDLCASEGQKVEYLS